MVRKRRRRMFMPRVRSEISSSLRAKAFGLLLASAGAVSVVSTAGAQDTGGLRGALDQNQGEGGGQQAQPYVPAGSGAEEDAVDDLDDGGSVLAPLGGGMFVDVPPTPSRSTLAARARHDARRGKGPPPTPPAAPRPTALDRQVITGTVRALPADNVQPKSQPAGPASAVEAIVLPPLDETPFRPVGMRVGNFVLRPTLEQGLTGTTNADYSVDGSKALLSETTLRLNAASDWSRNSLVFDAFGTYRKSLAGEEISDFRGAAVGTFELDLTDEWTASAVLGYETAPETAASPVTIVGVLDEPIRQTVKGSIGIEKDAGKARLAVTASVESDTYGDATLIDGTILSQEDRDSTLAMVTLRGGYEISPALVPFVEVEGGRRFYREDEDSAGFSRSGDIVGARGGVEVDFNEKLAGEISAGWIRESFEDDSLAPVEGPTLSALLSWSPERMTKVDAMASTILEGSTDPGESGSMLYLGELAVERQVRSNVTAKGIIGGGYRDYTGEDGHDILFNAELGATWWLNRYAGISGRWRYESQTSTDEDRNFNSNSIFLGLKVQR